jgi:hypothetical protein
MTSNEYDEDVLQTFLDNQDQLFPEPVADSPEEAEAFLEDCLAVVCDSKEDVVEYLSDSMDVDGMSMEDILDSPEVFALEDGRYLVVEG